MNKKILFLLLFLVVDALLIWLLFYPGYRPWDGKQTGLVVVNILDENLYKDCHIKGSINVPFARAEGYIRKRIDPHAEIVLYCSNFMCRSSSSIRRKLLTVDFDNVWVYRGGTAEWFQLGYPTVGPAKETYLHKKLRVLSTFKDYEISAWDLKERLEKSSIGND